MLRRLLSWLPGPGEANRDRPSPEQRADRIREIGRDPLAHGHDATEEVLAALSDESPLVRTTAAEVLGSVEVYHELVAADPLVDLLEDPERRVRYAAAEALTVTTDATVVDDILPYALADDPGVRAAGAVGLYHALSRVTYEFTPAQVEALLDAFAAAIEGDTTTEDNTLTREYLLSAIDRGAASRDLASLDADRTAALVDALDDESIAVGGQAAALLGHVGNEQARAALRDARESHPDERVRNAASEALADGT
ncbi:HEAT repeat [Halorientalis persicus]|uniref:HEAT repeat n=1 Tax=Halorientalis persicus TaxID=1367881 RepID=A0A1H8FGC2_9EURY|nr:HEAT repeat domain-containing protein [Halorientalis persicus]SEN30672.1 HEAT repeat [Halorientalis persicus]